MRQNSRLSSVDDLYFHDHEALTEDNWWLQQVEAGQVELHEISSRLHSEYHAVEFYPIGSIERRILDAVEATDNIWPESLTDFRTLTNSEDALEWIHTLENWSASVKGTIDPDALHSAENLQHWLEETCLEVDRYEISR